MTQDPERLEQIDRQTVFHSATQLHAHADGSGPPPRVIRGGKGVFIEDVRGNRLLDAFAGLYCVNVGYGREEIADAIAAQARQLAYYHTYVGHSNEPVIELSQRILQLAPKGMSKVYYGLGGSDANELNVKLVWYYHNVIGKPRKKKIISRLRAYHGNTVMAAGLTGLPLYHTAFDLPVGPILHTLAPYYHRRPDAGMSEQEFSQHCAASLEQMILDEGPDSIGAFIAEPVLGTGGIIPPPEGYWKAIQPVLRKYEILLIADEVVCGFGRLGANFGSDLYGIQPDLITVAKGLTSAYLPLSAVIVGERVWQVLEAGCDQFGPFGHGYTYSGHAVGAAAALANLKIVEREDLTGNARDTGAYLQARMRETFADHPMVGEVRGIGLLAALEFDADKAGRIPFDPGLKIGPRVAAACMAQGLIARAMPHGDILGFAPPLVISRDEVDQVVDLTLKGVNSVAAEQGLL